MNSADPNKVSRQNLVPSRAFLLLSLLLLLSQATSHHPRSFSQRQVSTYRRTREHHDEIIIKQLQHDARLLPPLSRLLSIRGGATKAINIVEEEESNSSGFVMTKVRNIIRSLLDIGDRKSPLLSKVARGFLKTLQSMTGVRLLPPPEPKEKKTKKKSKKKQKVATKEEESGKTTKTTKTVKSSASTVTKKKKANKSSSSIQPTKATAKHLDQPLSSKHANYRIQRELREFIKSPPPNLSVKVGSNIRVWIITMKGAENTIYEGDVFKLRVQFPPAYPTVPPSVYFLQPTPQHEHVYTNGDICLSLLGDGWRPTMTAQSIAVSILSILSSAQTKSLPMDNARHSQSKPGQYQKDWVYHDDNC